MISANINDRKRYECIHPGVAMALEALTEYTPENFPEGPVKLSEGVTLNFAKYETKSPEGALCEGHRQYIDVFYMVEGRETVYVKCTDLVKNVTRPYEAEIDAYLGETDSDVTAVRMEAGTFLILFPEDAHTPGCIAEESCSVKKIIGKVLVEY